MYRTVLYGETKAEVPESLKKRFQASGRERMVIIVQYLWSFIIGGAICVVAQILLDFTKLTPARILVMFVTLGVLLGAVGVYEPLVKFAGAGATVPLSGFGYLMAKGTREAVQEKGLLGAFSGGLTAGAAGISAAVFFGYLAALFSKSGDKS